MPTPTRPRARLSAARQVVSVFLRDDSGAVTVDWVVLTASLVGMTLALVAGIRTGLTSTTGGIETALSAAVLNDIDLGD
jgi:Flp pilus assembly pilin Flp